MEDLFIPYKEAVKLEQLGFDEEVIATYPKHSKIPKLNNVKTTSTLKAVLYQQAFDWFREKHNIRCHVEKGQNPENYYSVIHLTTKSISYKYDTESWFNTYKEAELDCIKKLIEIVNEQNRISI